MEKIIETFTQQSKKQDLADIRPGDTVRVHQKYRDKDKDKIQIFEGMVICRKHGNEIGATITVRKIASGVGVEKLFPLHSPIVDKIEIVRKSLVRRSKLYYLRDAKGKKSRLKQIEIKAKKEVKKEIPA